jgi:hypothetical protein
VVPTPAVAPRQPPRRPLHRALHRPCRHALPCHHPSFLRW